MVRMLVVLALGVLSASCGASEPRESGSEDSVSVQTDSQIVLETSIPVEAIELLTAEANPPNVDLELEGAHAAEVEIGLEGGLVEATSSSGLVYRLTIPEGALPQPTFILMTPIWRHRLQNAGEVASGPSAAPALR